MAGRAKNFERILRGDPAIARYVFGDERKRRLVKGLQEAGWAIFDLAGKRSAFPHALDEDMRKAVRTGQRRRRQREAATVTA